MRGTLTILTLVATVGAACDEGTDPTDLARVNEIVLSPEDTTVEHPDSFRYRVRLLDQDGAEIDDGVNRPMEFTAGSQAVVNVTSLGFVRTEEEGVTSITVEVGGASADATLTVTDDEVNPPAPADARPPSPM